MRMTQRKKKVNIPSEAFNQLLSERMAEVEQAFAVYLRRKNDLLMYIKAMAGRTGATAATNAARRLRSFEACEGLRGGGLSSEAMVSGL